MSRIEFTDHAIERYVQRHAPEMSLSEARWLLESAESAAPLRRKSLPGQTLWKMTNPDVTIVTKRDRGVDVCVTILATGMAESPIAELPYDENDEEVREVIERTIGHQRATQKARDERPAKSSAETPTILSEKTEVNNLRAQLESTKASAKKAHDRAVKHAESMHGERARNRSAIRALLLYVVARSYVDTDAEAVVKTVRGIDESLLEDGFLYRS